VLLGMKFFSVVIMIAICIFLDAEAGISIYSHF
jgi:hypothetical protein